MAKEIKLTKEQQQMIVASVLMTVAFVYSYWTYFWKPTSAKIVELRSKIESTDREITEARRQAARLPQLRAQIQELEEKAEAAEKKLPKTKELPLLIETLSDLARQNSVTIANFSQSGASTRDYFVEVNYTLQIRGSYHSIGRFLTALALQERIFHSRNLTLSPQSGGAAGETVSGQFQLVAFQYKG